MNYKKNFKILFLSIFCIMGIFIFGNFVFAAEENDIIINEIAAFEPSGYEWIEIYNTTNSEIDLTGWKFIEQFSETDQDGASHKLNSFQNGMAIKSNKYAIIAQDAEKFLEKYEISSDVIIIDSSWGSLKEAGERIALKDSDGDIIQDFTYLACPNYSLEKINPELNNYSADNWKESIAETPGEKNSVYSISENNNENENNKESNKEAENSENEENNQEDFSNNESDNNSLIADAGDDAEIFVNEEIEFDASDSYNSNGVEISFLWDFGDGNQGKGCETTHIYSAAGKYSVVLKISDGEIEDSDSLSITVKEEEFDYSEDIIINEILPNPEGKDSAKEPDGEWIEFFNQGDFDIDLAGWQIDDLKGGGSKPFIIPKNTIIKGESFLVFYYEKTKIALNNNGDEISLINPDGDLLDFVSYGEKVSEGNSFARADDGIWNWTENLTPAKENIISEKNKKINELEKDERDDLLFDKLNGEIASDGLSKENPLEVSLEEAKNFPKGAFVKVEGAVSVPPGILGKKIFYISGSGIQIYFFKENFPDLEIGDYISLVGKMSEQSGEKKINIEEKEDIVFIESDKIPIPEIVLTGDIDEDIVGSLVSVEGEITETSGNVFYIDDGTGEIKIYIRATTGIKKPKMKKGDWVSVVGIASKTSSGFRVLPRFQEDIILGSVAGVAILPNAGSNFILCLVFSLIFNWGVVFREDIFKNIKI